MSNITQGLHNKKADDELYCLKLQVVFPDPDGTQRCGMITFCVEKPDGKWYAFTARHLFAKTWDPATGKYDIKEDILGKPCFVGQWLTDRTADICHVDNGIIKQLQKIGNVVATSRDGCMAMILIDEEFAASSTFSSQGHWLKGASASAQTPPKIVHMTTVGKNSNTTHEIPSDQIKWINPDDINK